MLRAQELQVVEAYPSMQAAGSQDQFVFSS